MCPAYCSARVNKVSTACWSAQFVSDLRHRCINSGLLTVSMTLDLNDHLLEAPDSLLATLLGNLLGHVVLCLVGIFLSLVLR